MVTLPLPNELALIGFLFALWLSEVVCDRMLRVSPLLGQVGIGIILGPSLANIVPQVAGLMLIGKIGLYCIVIESALSFGAWLFAFISASFSATPCFALAAALCNVAVCRMLHVCRYVSVSSCAWAFVLCCVLGPSWASWFRFSRHLWLLWAG